MQHANQIKYAMSEIQYVKMFSDLGFDKHSDYEYDELRAFIRMSRIETKKVNADIRAYRMNKIKPEYIRDAGTWYNGLTLRSGKLKQVRLKAIKLRDDKK